MQRIFIAKTEGICNTVYKREKDQQKLLQKADAWNMLKDE